MLFDRKWYRGVVRACQPNQQTLTAVFDDGDVLKGVPLTDPDLRRPVQRYHDLALIFESLSQT